MGNYLKIKKRRIIFTFLLIFNQLILSSSYALGNKKLEIDVLEKNKLTSKYGKKSDIFISSKKRNKTNYKQEEVELDKFAEELEKFVEETFPKQYWWIENSRIQFHNNKELNLTNEESTKEKLKK